MTSNGHRHHRRQPQLQVVRSETVRRQQLGLTVTVRRQQQPPPGHSETVHQHHHAAPIQTLIASAVHVRTMTSKGRHHHRQQLPVVHSETVRRQQQLLLGHSKAVRRHHHAAPIQTLAASAVRVRTMTSNGHHRALHRRRVHQLPLAHSETAHRHPRVAPAPAVSAAPARISTAVRNLSHPAHPVVLQPRAVRLVPRRSTINHQEEILPGRCVLMQIKLVDTSQKESLDYIKTIRSGIQQDIRQPIFAIRF